jgi:protein disulfide-isomerase-like protein
MLFGKSLCVFILLVSVCIVQLLASDVVKLDSSNFEHLTQASTGATTGDWLIKFYAPWCGHCKSMAPAYERLATNLLGEVNVAEVNADKERGLRSRFDISGFPTIIFLRQGNVYKYKGPRTEEAFTKFVKGGYLDTSTKASPVPEPMSMTGEILREFTKAYTRAATDIGNGRYFSPSVLTCAMPIFFIIIILCLIFVPVDDEPVRRIKKKAMPVAAISKESESVESETNAETKKDS